MGAIDQLQREIEENLENLKSEEDPNLEGDYFHWLMLINSIKKEIEK